MSIAPRDLPELRIELREYAANGGAEWFWRRHLDMTGNTWHNSDVSPEAVAAKWGRVEHHRLTEAELFHVSGNMCQLIQQASGSMPSYSLMPPDVPAEVGMAYWTDAAAVSSQNLVQLATWSPAYGMCEPSKENPGGDGVWVTWYVPRRAFAQHALVSEDWDLFEEKVPARFVVFSKALLPFGQDAVVLPLMDNKVGDATEPAFAIPQERVRSLFTTWRLMQDKVAACTVRHPDRATQRRLRRQQEDVPTVRVIALRTATGATAGESELSRDYIHRWIVRGHWRMQRCGPEGSLRRPTWIAPHIKGPEDAPILGGEKVYALKR